MKLKLVSRVILIAVCICFAFAEDFNKLVFEDNFTGNDLHSSWEVQNTCDTPNHELNCNTNRQENIRVENGRLIITATVEDKGGKVKYYGAQMRNSKLFKYGRFEGRIRMPHGAFLWPALWLLPSYSDSPYGHWPRSGEIDIMEMRGQNPKWFQSAIHYGLQKDPSLQLRGGGAVKEDLDKEFHNFALVWTSKLLEFRFDDKPYLRINIDRYFNEKKGPKAYNHKSAPYDQPFGFVIDMVVGGYFFPEKEYGKLTVSQAKSWPKPTFEVDWVRIWQ